MSARTQISEIGSDFLQNGKFSQEKFDDAVVSPGDSQLKWIVKVISREIPMNFHLSKSQLRSCKIGTRISFQKSIRMVLMK